MASFFVMPQASPTMTVGVVAKWVAAEGAELKPQSVIAQVETDKATMDVEIFDKAVLLRHLVPEGAEVPAGAPMAIVGAAGEDISGLLAEYAKMAGGAAAPAGPGADAPEADAPEAEAPKADAPEADTPEAEAPKADTPRGDAPKAGAPKAEAPKAEAPKAEAPKADAPRADAPKADTPRADAPRADTPRADAPKPAERKTTAKSAETAADGTVPPITWMGKPLDASVMEPRAVYRVAGPRVVASPLAKAMAADKKVDLANVAGSGPGGRVVAADVESAAARLAVVAPAAAAAPGGRADQPVRVTQMRKTIARRLTEVHQAVPVFYLTVSFDGAGLVSLKELAASRGQKLTYNDLIIKAVARALRDVPEVNAAWMGDTIVRKASIDVGVAVALPEGLITPILREADRKSVGELAAEIRALAARAKEGKLDAAEYTGGSFTISNLGMLDIEHFTAILNPPEAAILAVGAMQQVPVVEKGALTVGWRMKATMTCDHRVIDGALGARFLQALRAYIEAPALLVL